MKNDSLELDHKHSISINTNQIFFPNKKINPEQYHNLV